MNRDIINVVAGGVLLAGSAGLYVFTLAAHYQMGTQIAYDAGLVPRLWLAIAALAAAAIVVQGGMGIVRARGAEPEKLERIGPERLALAGVLLIGLVLGFDYLGYWVTMLVFIPAFSLSFGYRRPMPLVLTTVGFAALTWVVFVNILAVQLQAWPSFG